MRSVSSYIIAVVVVLLFCVPYVQANEVNDQSSMEHNQLEAEYASDLRTIDFIEKETQDTAAQNMVATEQLSVVVEQRGIADSSPAQSADDSLAVEEANVTAVTSTDVPVGVQSPTFTATEEDCIAQHVNTHKISLFLNLSGGMSIPVHFSSKGNISKINIGVAPQLGGTLGFSWFPVVHFGFTLGVRGEHVFKSSLASLTINQDAIKVNGDTVEIKDFITQSKVKFERTSVLADMYFDFRQGIWSSFFLNVLAGYSWVSHEGKKDSGFTAGLGLGLRWYAHKYVSLDWTILDARATFLSKTIIPELGTRIGVSVRY